MKKARKIKKILLIGLSVLVGLCLLAAAAILLFVVKWPTHVDDFSKAELNKWNKITLGGEVKSGDGSDYYMLTKRGGSNNWIVFFSGGGMNWDEASTANPITLSSMLGGKALTYFANIPFYKVTTMNGILEADNAKNPFNDWNIVYIPYTTGDFHIGNNTVTYQKSGKTMTSYHNGRTNTLACLNWFFDHAAQPGKIFVCGESAGGFGAALWTPYIADHEKDAQIFEYSDSAYIRTDRWADIADGYWNADFEASFGYELGSDLITSALSYDAAAYPNITFLQSNTLYDGLLIDFQERLNGSPASSEYKSTWSAQMLSAANALSQNHPNYFYFITDYGLDAKSGTTPHTLSVAGSFYDAGSDNVRLCDWLYDSVENGLRRSAGTGFIKEAT